ncbi:uncharacterized protein LOC130676522 [Microplitis mediator]|uniref:uncharacterized protein LOC130676522 n=1 Tax=Microplitis mediator TaxID=375433 RepID=UPI0025527625|nr:uncharacterized protein LOC130676522 [Microplitis mediator]
MADETVAKERYMKYPYTWTAKLRFFPYKYHYKHAWLTKFWLAGILLTIPVYWKIQRLSYAPENVAKWREIRRKMYSGEDH